VTGTSDGAMCLKVCVDQGTGKTGLYRGLLQALYARVWWESGGLLTPEKIEFGIGGDAISRCLEGLRYNSDLG